MRLQFGTCCRSLPRIMPPVRRNVFPTPANPVMCLRTNPFLHSVLDLSGAFCDSPAAEAGANQMYNTC